jgi:hypothetical protein
MKQLERMLENFAPSAKSDWKEKAIADLKSRSFEDIEIHIADQIQMDPLYTQGEITADQRIFWGKKDNRWEICEFFALQPGVDPGYINALVIEALECGANALSFELSDPRFNYDYLSDLLKGVHLNMVNIHFNILEQAEMPSFHKTFTKFFEHHRNQAKLGISSSHTNQLDIISQNEFKWQTINLPDQADILKRLLYLKESILKICDESKIDSKNFPKSIIRSTCSSSYFYQIVEQRVTKLLVYACTEASGLEIPNFPLIEINVTADIPKDKPEAHLIELTTKTMSAVMGSCDRLIIKSDKGISKGSDEKTDRRIVRNIHNILMLESQLHINPDPLAGAYWIEKCTAEIFNAVWK